MSLPLLRRVFFVLLAAAAPIAHAEPWLCTNPDRSKHFTYDPLEAAEKKCAHHPIPSGNVVRVRPRSEMSAEAPATFPRVDAGTQKKRDAKRRAILERELAQERKQLAEAMQALEAQKTSAAKDAKTARGEPGVKPLMERIRVHLTNISNLEKELGREG